MESKKKVPISRFDSTLMWISKILAALSAAALAIMMFVSVADVGGRGLFTIVYKLFGISFAGPLEGASEMVSLTLVVASTLGIGYCELQKGQIRITIFTDLMKGKRKEIFNILAYLISAVAVGLVSWQVLSVKLLGFLASTRAVSEMKNIPYWPFGLLMFIGFVWITIILLVELVKSVREVIKK
jgi:TRAP-type C4-dicarboxylate transport system permease small subunit